MRARSCCGIAGWLSGAIVNGTHGPTGTHREQYRIARRLFGGLYPDLQQLVETDLPALEARLEEAGVPWTTGRALPRWPPE
jgi:hypothetical protein